MMRFIIAAPNDVYRNGGYYLARTTFVGGGDLTDVGREEIECRCSTVLGFRELSWQLWLGFRVLRSAMNFPSCLSRSARLPLRQRMLPGRSGFLCRSRPRLCRMFPASG